MVVDTGVADAFDFPLCLIRTVVGLWLPVFTAIEERRRKKKQSVETSIRGWKDRELKVLTVRRRRNKAKKKR